MRPLKFVAALILALASACSGSQPATRACGSPGQWLAPAEPTSPLAADRLLADLAQRQVVLLGESHDSAEDHRWQLHTLARLQALHPELAVGFEMFPRRLQPVLDRWVAGELAEAEFLEKVDWNRTWGFDAQDYLPLFHFARMSRLPMLALNVERSLPDAVGKQGWDGVADERKEGLSRPALPSKAYRRELKAVFEHHGDKKRDKAAFERFVEAQTVWDRAMAQAAAEHLRHHPSTLVVAILGAGHVRHGYGVAHQLKDLGIGRIGTLITWNQADDCSLMGTDVADALYVVSPPQAAQPRLGIAMDMAPAGVRIVAVDPGSIADQTGLKAGDVVTELAGRPASVASLRLAVQRQAPGTWLPMRVMRGEAGPDLVARFPPGP